MSCDEKGVRSLERLEKRIISIVKGAKRLRKGFLCFYCVLGVQGRQLINSTIFLIIFKENKFDHLPKISACCAFWPFTGLHSQYMIFMTRRQFNNGFTEWGTLTLWLLFSTWQCQYWMRTCIGFKLKTMDFDVMLFFILSNHHLLKSPIIHAFPASFSCIATQNWPTRCTSKLSLVFTKIQEFYWFYNTVQKYSSSRQ